jgi:hypothetical protein
LIYFFNQLYDARSHPTKEHPACNDSYSDASYIQAHVHKRGIPSGHKELNKLEKQSKGERHANTKQNPLHREAGEALKAEQKQKAENGHHGNMQSVLQDWVKAG